MLTPETRHVTRLFHVDSRDYINEKNKICSYQINLNDSKHNTREYFNVHKIELKVLSFPKIKNCDYVIMTCQDVEGQIDSIHHDVQNCTTVCYFDRSDMAENVRKPIYFGGNSFEFNPLKSFTKFNVNFQKHTDNGIELVDYSPVFPHSFLIEITYIEGKLY